MHHPTVQFNARIETPDGPLVGKVTIYTGPTRLAELVPSLAALTEGLVAMTLEGERKGGREVSCRPGCADCCRLMVPLSIPEVFFLWDLVASFDSERRQKLIERFENIVNRMEEEGLYARLRRPEIADEEHLQIAQDYFYLGLPCPFLESESCSIYPARPLACREYNVTTPADWCSHPYVHQIKTVKPAIAVPVVLAHLSARLLGLPVKMIPLAVALRWATENAELQQRTWPGKQLFEQFMAQFNACGKKDTAPDKTDSAH